MAHLPVLFNGTKRIATLTFAPSCRMPKKWWQVTPLPRSDAAAPKYKGSDWASVPTVLVFGKKPGGIFLLAGTACSAPVAVWPRLLHPAAADAGEASTFTQRPPEWPANRRGNLSLYANEDRSLRLSSVNLRGAAGGCFCLAPQRDRPQGRAGLQGQNRPQRVIGGASPASGSGSDPPSVGWTRIPP